MAVPSPTKVSLAEKFDLFSERWAPRLAARYNGNEVRLARVEGEYHWHSHPESDELFLVVEGCLLVDLAGGHTLRLGTLAVSDGTGQHGSTDPYRGTDHQPMLRGAGNRYDFRNWGCGPLDP